MQHSLVLHCHGGAIIRSECERKSKDFGYEASIPDLPIPKVILFHRSRVLSVSLSRLPVPDSTFINMRTQALSELETNARLWVLKLCLHNTPWCGEGAGYLFPCIDCIAPGRWLNRRSLCSRISSIIYASYFLYSTLSIDLVKRVVLTANFEN